MELKKFGNKVEVETQKKSIIQKDGGEERQEDSYMCICST